MFRASRPCPPPRYHYRCHHITIAIVAAAVLNQTALSPRHTPYTRPEQTMYPGSPLAGGRRDEGHAALTSNHVGLAPQCACVQMSHGPLTSEIMGELPLGAAWRRQSREPL